MLCLLEFALTKHKLSSLLMKTFKWQKILKNAQKELIELLLLESEAIIEKIQLEVDNLVNTLFPKDQEEVKKHLKEKNRKLKE